MMDVCDTTIDTLHHHQQQTNKKLSKRRQRPMGIGQCYILFCLITIIYTYVVVKTVPILSSSSSSSSSSSYWFVESSTATRSSNSGINNSIRPRSIVRQQQQQQQSSLSIQQNQPNNNTNDPFNWRSFDNPNNDTETLYYSPSYNVDSSTIIEPSTNVHGSRNDVDIISSDYSTFRSNDVMENYEQNMKNEEMVDDDEDDDDDIVSLLQPPVIHLQDMVSLLHFTSHMNERLQSLRHPYDIIDPTTHSTQQQQQYYSTSPAFVTSTPSTLHHQQQHQQQQYRTNLMDQFIRGGETTQVSSLYDDSNVSPTRRRTTPYRIPYTRYNSNVQQPHASQTNAFHYDHHVKCNKENDVNDLSHFMSNVFRVLDDDDTNTETSASSLERTLMMIYLDRACTGSRHRYCSMESRSTNSDVVGGTIVSAFVPYCTPSTVRYLSVTAYLIALGTVRGNLLLCYNTYNQNNNHYHNTYMQSLYHTLERTLGIPVMDTQHRVTIMLQSLLSHQQEIHHRSSCPDTSSSSSTTINWNNVDGAETIDITLEHHHDEDYYESNDDDDDDESYYYENQDDDTGIYITPNTLQGWKDQWEAQFAGRV